MKTVSERFPRFFDNYRLSEFFCNPGFRREILSRHRSYDYCQLEPLESHRILSYTYTHKIGIIATDEGRLEIRKDCGWSYR